MAFRAVLEASDAGDGVAAAREYNAHVRKFMKFGARLNESPKRSEQRFEFMPDDLITGLALQLADEVTGLKKSRQCEWCPQWFTYGPHTGRTSKARFCSDRCRVASNRAKQKGNG